MTLAMDFPSRFLSYTTALPETHIKRLVFLSGVKRICFGHALDEDNMRFSCFPRAANILGKRGSINLTPLPNNESNSIGNLNVISPDSTITRAEIYLSLLSVAEWKREECDYRYLQTIR